MSLAMRQNVLGQESGRRVTKMYLQKEQLEYD